MANKPELIKAVMVLAKATGWDLDKDTLSAIVTQLSRYPHAPTMAAINRCMVEHRGQMTLGAIIDRIEDGHLGPESAWALVSQIGESETVVWTDQIARAYGVAMPLLQAGDHVAARMAFLETYRNELGRVRATAEAPIWFASLGWDPAGRQGPITRAVEQGKLSPHAAMRMLPKHEWVSSWHPEKALPESQDTKENEAQVRGLVGGLVQKLSADHRAEIIRKAKDNPPTENTK